MRVNPRFSPFRGIAQSAYNPIRSIIARRDINNLFCAARPCVFAARALWLFFFFIARALLFSPASSASTPFLRSRYICARVSLPFCLGFYLALAFHWIDVAANRICGRGFACDSTIFLEPRATARVLRFFIVSLYAFCGSASVPSAKQGIFQTVPLLINYSTACLQ